jgi:psp operon transcriptional activator
VRELRNVVERSVHRMADPRSELSEIALDPFLSPWRPAPPQTQPVAEAGAAGHAAATPQGRTPEAGVPSAGDFAALTRAYAAALLRAALEACRHNQAEAARRLGLSYYQFRHHLRVHGMLAAKAGGGRAGAARNAGGGAQAGTGPRLEGA